MEKEKREMSPVHNQMLRTFNASLNPDMRITGRISM